MVRPEETGETLNDAIYLANKTVENRFDIVFEEVSVSADTNITEVVANAQAGDDVYDIVTMHDVTSTSIMLQGAYRNVYDLEYIDTTKPWWPEHTVNSLTVQGKMYGIANSMSYYGLASTRCLYFNKDMMIDMGLDLPYDAVRSGEWYLDDLINLTKDVYSDLDQDGTHSVNDQYGFALTGGPYALLECFGIDTYGRDEQGNITENFKTDRNVGAVQTLNDWFFGGSTGVYFSVNHKGYFESDSALMMFANGNVMFSFNSITRQTTACMDSDVNYGIVPMPKLDETQEDYIGGCVDHPNSIPITNTNMERTGIIIEAMSAEGYRTVQPAYTETVMKERYSSDKDSAEMLDLIFNNRFLAGGYLYANFPDFQMIHEVMWRQASSNIDIISYYESHKNAAQARVDQLNEFFNKVVE